jgi:hypothetical protein
MAREAVKGIREKVVEQGWFGQRDGPGEPGMPLNPTPQMVTKDLGTVYGNQSWRQQLQDASQRGHDQQQEMER